MVDQVRGDTLWRQIETTFKEVDTLGTEFECFRALHRQEQLAAPRRIENLQDAVKEQSDKERMLQLQYENLLVEKENLKGFLRQNSERNNPDVGSDDMQLESENPANEELLKKTRTSNQVDSDLPAVKSDDHVNPVESMKAAGEQRALEEVSTA